MFCENTRIPELRSAKKTDDTKYPINPINEPDRALRTPPISQIIAQT